MSLHNAQGLTSPRKAVLYVRRFMTNTQSLASHIYCFRCTASHHCKVIAHSPCSLQVLTPILNLSPSNPTQTLHSINVIWQDPWSQTLFCLSQQLFSQLFSKGAKESSRVRLSVFHVHGAEALTITRLIKLFMEIPTKCTKWNEDV